MITGLLAAVEYGGEWELPEISHLFEFPPLPGTENWELFGVPLWINRTVLLTFLAAIIVAALFIVAFRKPSVVPGKLQAAMESVVEFVRNNIAVEIIGPEGVRYVPLLTTMFMFIFIGNLMKITPFIMYPITSAIALPLFLAVISWIMFVGIGFKNHGISYLKDIAFPPGVPKPVYLLLTPIELLSNFVLRPFTLAVRLFANMVAGHILVVITLVTIHVFLALRPGLPVGIFALAASPLVFGFELLVISLQAYIFTMLTAVYISSSLHPQH